MKYPKFLKQNDTIYYIAPSFGCTIEPYHSRMLKSIEHLKNLGFKIIVGENCNSQINEASNTIEKRVEEFMQAYKSNASLLLSVGGGEMMYDLLDYIDFDYLKTLEPRWFMGYSDNTNLSLLLTTLCDVATIYGPCAPEFGSNKLTDYQMDAINLFQGKTLNFNGYPMYEIESLKNEDVYASLNLTEEKILTLYPNNTLNFEGRLLGGCMDLLTLYLGTKYDKVYEFTKKYEDDGIIWFIEPCELNVCEIKRRLLQLKRANWFNNCKGVIFGRYANNRELFGLNQFNCITDVLSDLDIPIIMNADIGHIKPMIPLITGAYAKVNAQGNDINIEMILK